MIVASDEIKGKEIMEQHVLHGGGMPDEWKTSVTVPIFKRKSDVMHCGLYRGVKLLKHAMKIVERVLERQIQTRDVEASVLPIASTSTPITFASLPLTKNKKTIVDNF